MSELDQTIEELEAEVMAELDEKAHQPGKVGLKAEPMHKISSDDPLKSINDTGKAHVDADQPLPDEGDSKTAAALPGKKPAPVKMQKIKNPNASADSSDQGQSRSAPGQMPMQKVKKGKHMENFDDDDYEEDLYEEEGEVVTREDLVDHLYSAMEQMDDDQLQSLYASAFAVEEDYSDEDDELAEVVEMQIQNIDITADVEALMEGEDLSEEFKEKAAVIFEAAVKSKTRDEVTRIIEEQQIAIAEEIDEYKNSLASKVDDYLEYVVEEWMKENELAIERGLKGEIAEDFISGLKQLFEDHYIDVPDERYDILEAQSDRIAELEEHINSIMEQNIEMKSTNSDLVREQVILEVSSDLADTEFETFKSLTEDIDFNDEDNFRQKLDTLKESYFPRTGYETYEIDDEDYGSAVQDIDTTDAMRAYMSAIGRTEKRINGGA